MNFSAMIFGTQVPFVTAKTVLKYQKAPMKQVIVGGQPI